MKISQKNGRKSNTMRLQDSTLLRDLDRTLALAGVILSLALIVYLGRKSSGVVYQLTGVLTLISCLLWLAIRKRHTFAFHPPGSRTLASFWTICFFGLYTASLLEVHLRPHQYERPLLYFILTALMAGVLACEIFTSGRRRGALIFIQVLLLGLSVAWSQLLIFPSLLGVDPWYHSDLTQQILGAGFIPENYVYATLPLFHLMIAATSLITGLSYKFAAMASVSLGQILCNAIFVYLIASRLFRSQRIGWLAALMVVIGNHHINMSYWSIPNAFAAVFIPIALYLILFRFRDRFPAKSAALCVVVLAATILTHTVAAMCMAILLFIAWGAFAFYEVYHPEMENNFPLYIPNGFLIGMFAWWTYASNSIESLGSLLRRGFSIDVFVTTPEEFLGSATVVPISEQLFNNIGMFLFFTVSFIGIFSMISPKGNRLSFAIACTGVAPLAISFFSLISGHSVIEHRWWYFSQILLSIPLAVALSTAGASNLKRPRVVSFFASAFVVVLSFLMIMSPPANIDNHIFSPVTGFTYAYTQSEIVASDFFAVHAAGAIASDSAYCTNPSSSMFAHVYGIGEERLIELDDSLISGTFDRDGSMKIIRSKWLREPMIMGGLILHVRPDINAHISSLGFNRVYENAAATGYTG